MKHASSRLPSATAILAIVLAAFLAGCSTTRDHEEEFLDAEKAAALVGKLEFRDPVLVEQRDRRPVFHRLLEVVD